MNLWLSTKNDNNKASSWAHQVKIKKYSSVLCDKWAPTVDTNSLYSLLCALLLYYQEELPLSLRFSSTRAIITAKMSCLHSSVWIISVDCPRKIGRVMVQMQTYIHSQTNSEIINVPNNKQPSISWKPSSIQANYSASSFLLLLEISSELSYSC